MLHVVLPGHARLARAGDAPRTVVQAYAGLVVGEPRALLGGRLIVGQVRAKVVPEVVNVAAEALDVDEAVAPGVAHGVVVLRVGHVRGRAVEEQDAVHVPRAAGLALLDVEVFEGAVHLPQPLEELPQIGGNAAVVGHVLGVGEGHESDALVAAHVGVDDRLEAVEGLPNRFEVVALGLAPGRVAPEFRRRGDHVVVGVDAPNPRLGRRVEGAVAIHDGVPAVDRLEVLHGFHDAHDLPPRP